MKAHGALLVCLLACGLVSGALGQDMPGIVPPGAVGLSESFDTETLPGWELGPGWQVGHHAAGPSCLHGTGHDWASYTARKWSDFTLSLKLSLVRGAIHVNYRIDGPHRYFVGLRQDAIYLMKQTGPEEFSGELATSQNPAGLSLNQWHTVAVSGTGGALTVTVDGVTALTYTDPQPLTQGGIAFETLDDSEAWIDDVAVVPGAAQPPGGTGAGQTTETPLMTVPAISGSVLQQLATLPTRAGIVQALQSSPTAGGALAAAAQKAGVQPGQLQTQGADGTKVPGRVVQSPLSLQAVKSVLATLPKAQSVSDLDWGAGVHFGFPAGGPRYVHGGKIYNAGSLGARNVLLPAGKGMDEANRHGVVRLLAPCEVQLSLELPPGAGTYAIAVLLVDENGKNHARWVQPGTMAPGVVGSMANMGSMPFVNLEYSCPSAALGGGIATAAGASMVAPKRAALSTLDGSGYVAMCNLSPIAQTHLDAAAPAMGMRRVNCHLKLKVRWPQLSDLDTTPAGFLQSGGVGALAKMPPGGRPLPSKPVLLFRGFTITRL